MIAAKDISTTTSLVVRVATNPGQPWLWVWHMVPMLEKYKDGDTISHADARIIGLAIRLERSLREPYLERFESEGSASALRSVRAACEAFSRTHDGIQIEVIEGQET